MDLNEESGTNVNKNDLGTKAQNLKLKNQECVFLAAALEDGIKEILLLNACSREFRKKLSLPNVVIEYSEENSFENESKLGSDSQKLIKMDSDREYVRDLLIKTYLDIKINQNYASFQINLYDMATKAYQYLSEELVHKENKQKLKSLQEELKCEIKVNKSTEYDLDCQINALKDEINDMQWNCEIKKNYMEKWKQAQCEQFEMRMQQIEKKYKDELAENKQKIEDEILINAEIEKFTTVITQDLANQVKTWVRRYNEEFEDKSECIDTLIEKRRVQMENIQAVKKLLDEHKSEMDEWCETILQRKRVAERQLLEQKSATKIQAWWRGISFRRKLAKNSAKNAKSAKKKKKK